MALGSKEQKVLEDFAKTLKAEIMAESRAEIKAEVEAGKKSIRSWFKANFEIQK